MAFEVSKLRFYRLREGLTIEQAAKELGISRQTLAKYEENEIPLPVTLFIKIVALYKIDSISLLGVEDISSSAFEFDVSPYYLIKLYAHQHIKDEIAKEQSFTETQPDTAYFVTRYKELVKEYINSLSLSNPDTKTELETEFLNDTDFQINEKFIL
jgi:transcriptional regulator with XRE-family HTH domain